MEKNNIYIRLPETMACFHGFFCIINKSQIYHFIPISKYPVIHYLQIGSQLIF